MQASRGMTIEVQDAQEHHPEGRPKEIPSLGEDRIKGFAPVRQAGVLVKVAEAHAALLLIHAELRKERQKGGVGFLVEYDEARINRGARVLSLLDDNGMGMTADIIILFIERNLMSSLQQIGRHNPRHTGTDHRNLHNRAPPHPMSNCATITIFKVRAGSEKSSCPHFARKIHPDWGGDVF